MEAEQGVLSKVEGQGEHLMHSQWLFNTKCVVICFFTVAAKAKVRFLHAFQPDDIFAQLLTKWSDKSFSMISIHWYFLTHESRLLTFLIQLRYSTPWKEKNYRIVCVRHINVAVQQLNVRLLECFGLMHYRQLEATLLAGQINDFVCQYPERSHILANTAGYVSVASWYYKFKLNLGVCCPVFERLNSWNESHISLCSESRSTAFS